jgi:hypothetical protein
MRTCIPCLRDFFILNLRDCQVARIRMFLPRSEPLSPNYANSLRFCQMAEDDSS